MKYYQEHRFSSFRELIDRSAVYYGEKTAFYYRTEEGYHSVTYLALQKDFYALCNVFLRKGWQGARIAVIGKNSYEWVLCYLAAATVGVAVPLDKDSDASDIANFARIAACPVICADDTLADKIPDTLCPIRFSEIKPFIRRTPCDREVIRALTAPPDQMQILLFTSGTTGYAKGVCLSQHNILSNIHSTVSVVKVKSSDRTLSILPLHHTYECTVNCLLLLSCGACITYADSLTKIQKNMVEYAPSVLVAVPALLQVLHKRILGKILNDMPSVYKPLFDKYAFSTAMRKLPFFVRGILCKKVKQALGGNVRLLIVGAAGIDSQLIQDFLSLGIRTLQGYGLTECSPLVACNHDFYLNPCSTGVAVPGVELMIDRPDREGVGEILARGDNIMLGYFQDEQATDAVFVNGWFRTGDLGRLGKDGELYITGRIKNVIVAENGKNIFPEELEARLFAFAEIEESIVFSYEENGKTYIKAKLYPASEALQAHFGHTPSEEEIKQHMAQIIAQINDKLPDYKRIRTWELLSENLERTTTRKIKRYGKNLA